MARKTSSGEHFFFAVASLLLLFFFLFLLAVNILKFPDMITNMLVVKTVSFSGRLLARVPRSGVVEFVEREKKKRKKEREKSVVRGRKFHCNRRVRYNIIAS